MKENKSVSVRLVNFNAQEFNSFQAILTLATRSLKQTWQLVNSDEADFYLLSVAESNKPKAFTAFPLERCIFCVTKNKAQTEHSLLVDQNHVPSLSALVGLFNQLTAKPDFASAIKLPESVLPIPNAAVLTEPRSSEAQFFDPNKGLLGGLLSTQPQQLIVDLNERADCAPLYIDKENGLYYSHCTIGELQLYMEAPELLNIKSSSRLEIDDYAAGKNLKPRSLKDLVWYLVISTSAGQVIKGHLDTDIVTLKAWPDLRLFKFLEYAKLATFMKHNAAPLNMVAEETKTPVAAVNNFYNACYLIGLIEKKPQVEIHKKNITPELSELLSKIDARLR